MWTDLMFATVALLTLAAIAGWAMWRMWIDMWRHDYE